MSLYFLRKENRTRVAIALTQFQAIITKKGMVSHAWVAGAVALTGVGLALGKRWFSGGRFHGYPDLGGKVAVVTGANAGIGFETALFLAQQGAQVVLACRNKGKAEAAKKDIERRLKRRGKTAMLFVEELDLNSLASVREFATRFLAKFPRLDILVNNAGIIGEKGQVTQDGIEANFGVNHLAHFLLTGLLLDRLKQSAPSRVVVVSSKAHGGAFKDQAFDSRTGYPNSPGVFSNYSYSKLCNISFAFELNRRMGILCCAFFL